MSYLGQPPIGQASEFFTITPAVVEVLATGTVTLDSGGSGSVDGITVDGVEIMSGVENFDTDLDQTAINVAANITANTSAPNYTAAAASSVITITAIAGTGAEPNSFVVVSSTTTIVSTDVNMSGGVTDTMGTIFKPFTVYVGITGDLELVGLDDVKKVLTNVPVGWFNVQVKQVVAANTNASELIGGR